MKQHKIIAIVSKDDKVRRSLLKKMIAAKGFATSLSDAEKLIRPSVYDYDFTEAYFIIADNVRFHSNTILIQTLYRLAVSGLAVIIGTTRIPSQYEFMFEVHHE